MYVSDKGALILKQLLKGSQPMSSEKIASEVGISSRSVREYLNELGDVLKCSECRLIRKTGVGIYIEGSAEEKERLIALLSEKEVSTLDAHTRWEYIVRTLLKSDTAYTIQLLADDLYVSKGLITKDLNEVERWLKGWNILLLKKPNYGIALVGEEIDIRNAINYYYEYIYKQEDASDLSAGKNERDYRINADFIKKISDIYPKLNILKVIDVLKNAENMLGCVYTSEGFRNFVFRICIMLDRVRHNNFYQTKNMKLEGNIEYNVAGWIVRELSGIHDLDIPNDETEYVTVCMTGINRQRDLGKQVYGEADSEYREMSLEIIRLIESILGIDLSLDTELLNNMSIHIKSMVARMKSHMHLKNPILDEIKKEYASVYGACWACSSIFEKHLGIMLNDDEVAYIAVYIALAIAKQRHKIKALIVCASGVGVSHIVSEKIMRMLPDIYVERVLPYNDLTEESINAVDLVISTVPCSEYNEKIIVVSTNISQYDVDKIQKIIDKKFQPAQDHGDRSMGELIRPELIVLNMNEKNKEAVLLKGCRMLYDNRAVKDGFTESVLQREAITSTSVGKGVAIPHSLPGFVICPAICIIKLKKPVDWGGDKVDLIFILALNFSDINSTKSFFSKFYSMLGDEDILNRLRATESKEQFIKILTGEK